MAATRKQQQKRRVADIDVELFQTSEPSLKVGTADVQIQQFGLHGQQFGQHDKDMLVGVPEKNELGTISSKGGMFTGWSNNIRTHHIVSVCYPSLSQETCGQTAKAH